MKTKSGQDLKELLVELYSYYFGNVKKAINGENEKKDYQAGVFSGGLDAVSAIFLEMYGSRELMELWNSQPLKDSEVSTDDQKTGG